MDMDEHQEVLNEEVDASYEPSQQEIDEYARWLGMNLEEEKELFWIAKEGLKAALPENWKPCKTPKGDVYYFNFATGESIWDHPCDEHYRKLYKDEKEKLMQKKKEASQKKRSGSSEQGSLSGSKIPKPTSRKNSGELPGLERAAGKPPLSASATSLAMMVDPRERRKQQRQMSRSGGLSSGANSLHSSFDSDSGMGPGNLGGGAGSLSNSRDIGNKDGGSLSLNNSRDIALAPIRGTAAATPRSSGGGALGKMPPLGAPLTKGPPLGSSSASLSASGSDWPAANAPPQHLGTLKVPSKSRSTSAEKERQRSGRLEPEQSEDERRHTLKKFKTEAAAEEASIRQKLEDSSRLAIRDLKKQLEAKEEREKHEQVQRHQQQISQMESAHADLMSGLRRRHEDLEREMQQKISSAKRALEAEEVATSKEEARAAAVKEVKAEAAAWAESQKAELKQQSLEAAKTEVEKEIYALKEAKRAEALEQYSKEAVAESEQLQTRVANMRKQLSEMEVQLTDRNAAARAAEADLATCKEQLPDLEVKVKSMRRERNELETELTEKKASFDEVQDSLMSKKKELMELEGKLSALEIKLKPMAAELERVESALHATRKALAADEFELQKVAAQQKVADQQAATLKVSTEEKQAALSQMESTLAAQQKELAKVTSDLGKARSEMLTKDMTLATELRHRAGTELNEVEEKLSRCKKELAEATPLLISRKAELEMLGDVSMELQDKQKHCSATSVQLSACQAELAELESDLAAKRSQLDTVATILTSKRKELSFEEQRKAISDEEKLLLELQRQRMERGVEEKVQSERAQLLASKLGSMHLEVQNRVDGQRSGGTETAAASKRPKLEPLSSTGTPLDMSSSTVLVDSPVLPEDNKAGPSGAREKWWTQPGPADKDQGGEDLWSMRASGSQQQQASILPKALSFMKQQKRFLRERSAMVQEAMTEWRTAMGAMEVEPDPVLRHQQATLLHKVKATLEEQAHRVNEDTMQLSALKVQVQALQAQQGPTAARGHRSSTTALDSMRHSRTAWGESGEEDGEGYYSSLARTGAPGTDILRASIDKISMALESAVAAAVAQGMAAANASQQSSGYALHALAEGRVQSANRGGSHAGLRASQTRSRSARLDRGAHMDSMASFVPDVRGSLGLSNGGGGDLLSLLHSRNGNAKVPPTSAYMPGPRGGTQPQGKNKQGAQLNDFLGQWKSKSDMNEALLKQHAQWLKGFREVENGVSAARQKPPLTSSFHW